MEHRNPRSPVPKVRLEKRVGKSVTTISGLHTYGSKRLDTIARELKSKLATGGTVKNGTIELQGDKVAAVQNWFKNTSMILLVGACLLIGGCSTTAPIERKYQDLEALYKSGGLTADEYAAAKQKIMRESLEQAKAMAQEENKVSHNKREHD